MNTKKNSSVRRKINLYFHLIQLYIRRLNYLKFNKLKFYSKKRFFKYNLIDFNLFKGNEFVYVTNHLDLDIFTKLTNITT